MAPIAVICIALTALCIGYHFGRRAGSTPVPWRKRTSRVALARAALSLVLLVGARRVQRNYLIRALKVVGRGVSRCSASVELRAS